MNQERKCCEKCEGNPEYKTITGHETASITHCACPCHHPGKEECEHEIDIVRDSKVGARAYCKKCGAEVAQEPHPVEEWEREIRMVARPSEMTKGGLEVVYDPDALIDQIRQLLSSNRERVRAEERLRATEILHKYFMATFDKKVMDTIEAAQKEILTTPQQ